MGVLKAQGMQWGRAQGLHPRRWRNAYVMAPPLPPDHRRLGEVALIAVRVAGLAARHEDQCIGEASKRKTNETSAQTNQTSCDQRSSLWRATKPAQQQTKTCPTRPAQSNILHVGIRFGNAYQQKIVQTKRKQATRSSNTTPRHTITIQFEADASAFSGQSWPRRQ